MGHSGKQANLGPDRFLSRPAGVMSGMRNEQDLRREVFLEDVVLTRARAGDADAFRELTDPFRRELQLYCYRIVGSVQDAEDGVQETLLAACRTRAVRGQSSGSRLALPDRNEPVPERPAWPPTPSERGSSHGRTA